MFSHDISRVLCQIQAAVQDWGAEGSKSRPLCRITTHRGPKPSRYIGLERVRLQIKAVLQDVTYVFSPARAGAFSPHASLWMSLLSLHVLSLVGVSEFRKKKRKLYDLKSTNAQILHGLTNTLTTLMTAQQRHRQTPNFSGSTDSLILRSFYGVRFSYRVREDPSELHFNACLTMHTYGLYCKSPTSSHRSSTSHCKCSFIYAYLPYLHMGISLYAYLSYFTYMWNFTVGPP